MALDIFRNIVSFFILIFVQVLVLNNIQFSGYINPYLYVLFILMLPFNTPNWLVLFLSFLLGIFVDAFSNSFGMHTAAATFIGFCRPYILQVMRPRDGYDNNDKPTIRDMGMNWYLTYSGILVALHHFVYFYIEVFRFNEIFAIFSRIFLSSVFTMLLLVLTQYLFVAEKKKN